MGCFLRLFTGIKLALLSLAIMSLASCKHEKTHQGLQNIIENKVVRVGTLFGPSSYYIGANGPAGFEYELAKKYADHLGVRLEIVPSYNLSELFPKLDEGSVDFLAAGLAVTPGRLERYRFAPSYAQISQKLVFRQGKVRPREIDDLTGKLVVSSNSSHAENLLSLKQEHQQLQWQETQEFDSDELLVKVLEDEIDYTIADSHTLAINRRYYPDISIGFTIKEPQPLAWVLAKNTDDSVFASLVEFFGTVHSDGTLLALDDKYYGHIQKFNYVDTRLFMQAVNEKLPKYQPLFERYAQELDWRLLAAISYQESHWDPRARSHTGVRGMMMLTLPTAKQMGVTSRLDAEQSIQGGAKYLAKLLTRIPERISEPDRLWFALASYNIGWGHVEDARKITQSQGGDPDRWVDVKQRLPLLKQKKFYKKTRYGYARGDEPVVYVENIRRYYDTLSWLDQQQKSQLTLSSDNQAPSLSPTASIQ
jgi:membrane-bound lytic murein transglycosylase F